MNAEFNWWLLIVGLVIGAGLVWLVVADTRRRETDLTELERDGEAQWISATLRDAGRRVAEVDVVDVLRLHAAYLSAAPPDEPYDGEPALMASDRSAADDESRWVEVAEPRAPEGEPTRR